MVPAAAPGGDALVAGAAGRVRGGRNGFLAAAEWGVVDGAPQRHVMPSARLGPCVCDEGRADEDEDEEVPRFRGSDSGVMGAADADLFGCTPVAGGGIIIGGGVGAGTGCCGKGEVWCAEGRGGTGVCLGGAAVTFCAGVDTSRSAVGVERIGVGEGGAARFLEYLVEGERGGTR